MISCCKKERGTVISAAFMRHSKFSRNLNLIIFVCSDPVASGISIGINAYEIKIIDCIQKPEFVLVLVEYFENIYIALLRCTKKETIGRKYKTIIEGVFASAWSDIRFRIPSLKPFNLHIWFTGKLASYSKRKRCRVMPFTFTRSFVSKGGILNFSLTKSFKNIESLAPQSTLEYQKL